MYKGNRPFLLVHSPSILDFYDASVKKLPSLNNRPIGQPQPEVPSLATLRPTKSGQYMLTAI
jgi:hypothetical protein